MTDIYILQSLCVIMNYRFRTEPDILLLSLYEFTIVTYTHRSEEAVCYLPGLYCISGGACSSLMDLGNGLYCVIYCLMDLVFEV